MTPEGKKIWNSLAGGSLMRAMMREKPVTKQDEETIAALVATSKEGKKQAEELNASIPPAREDEVRSSRSRSSATRADIEALRRHVSSLPLDKKPTPETLAQLEKGRAIRDSARADRHQSVTSAKGASMTDEQLELINQLPDTWKDLILDHEAKNWIMRRESAREVASDFRKDGGHMMLMDEVVDPDTLPEPLQSRVKMMLEHLRPDTDKLVRF